MKIIHKDITVFVLVAAIVIGSYLVAGQLLDFAQGKSPIIGQYLAALIGSIVTVSMLAVLIRIQTQYDIMRESATRLFEQKLAIYRDLIEKLFKSDDDNIISKDEIQDIENSIGIACLVASEDLVSLCSQFIYQLKTYAVVFFRSMTNTQIDHFFHLIESGKKEESAEKSFLANSKFLLKEPVTRDNANYYFVSLDELIQAMRHDLNVVKGDIKEEIEHFVRLPYDGHHQICDPSIVDR